MKTPGAEEWAGHAYTWSEPLLQHSGLTARTTLPCSANLCTKVSLPAVNPGIRWPAGPWQVWGAWPPTAAAQQPLGSTSAPPSQMQISDCWVESSGSSFPIPLHWMKHLHFWCHIQATTKPIFINSDLVMMFTMTGCAPLGAGNAAEVHF